MTEGTRSNLWVAMREAIAQLRPRIVVWENVRGAYSAAADSALESEPGLLDRVRRRDGEPVLRALGRVLGDLSDLGYVGGWHGLRAADVGAPHGRFRVFVVAGVESLFPTPRATHGTKGGAGQRGSSGDLMLPSAVALLPTPTVQDGANNGGPSQYDRNSVPLNALVTLLPTPAVNDMGEGKTPDRWDEWTADMQAKHGNGNGHGKSLAIEAQRLLPTPRVTQAGYADDGRGGRSLDVEARLLPTPRTQNNENRQNAGYVGEDGNFYGLLHNPDRWGDYTPAIARWEAILGRPAPAPTQTSAKGNPQLSPAFVEWLMGLPAGWITDVPGITRNEALKALGNGVVPQQAEAAIRWLLARIEAAA
jgi:DNA (cytosine-5)-methyltransferase 1